MEFKVESKLNSKKNSDASKNQIQITDTITNWKFYKDSELLFKSNISNSNRFTAEIKTSDNYEYLIFNIFYDFNNKKMKRKIDLINENKIIATFTNENVSHSAFQIPKTEIDKIIIGNIGKEMFLNYTDRINEKGMIFGILKFINK